MGSVTSIRFYVFYSDITISYVGGINSNLIDGNITLLDPVLDPELCLGVCGQNPTGQNPTLTKPHRTKPHWTKPHPQPDKTPLHS